MLEHSFTDAIPTAVLKYFPSPLNSKLTGGTGHSTPGVQQDLQLPEHRLSRANIQMGSRPRLPSIHPGVPFRQRNEQLEFKFSLFLWRILCTMPGTCKYFNQTPIPAGITFYLPTDSYTGRYRSR